MSTSRPETLDLYEAALERSQEARQPVATGRAVAAAIPSLQIALRECRDLLGAELTPEQQRTLRTSIAVTQEKLASVLGSLGRSAEARTAYAEARRVYLDLGDTAAAHTCRVRSEGLAHPEAGCDGTLRPAH